MNKERERNVWNERVAEKENDRQTDTYDGKRKEKIGASDLVC